MLPAVIGHRGAAAEAPENTLAGIEAAAAAGASWVEFDVRLTADAVPVLLHDASLKRTTGLRRRIAAAAWGELKALDAGGWFSPRFAGEPPATLDGALATLNRLGLGGNVEIKPDLARADLVATTVVAHLGRATGGEAPAVLVSSMDERMLEAVRRIDGAVPMGLILARRRRRWRAIAERLGCRTVHCSNAWVDARDIELFRAAGLGVAVFTVNDPLRAAALIGQGALGVFTDRPGEMIRRLGLPAA